MNPVTTRKWQQRKELPALQDSCVDLARSLGIGELTAQLLVLRGLASGEEGRTFLSARLSSLPDPALLPDMEDACARIQKALSAEERIAVYGDYDVDGITGCALLVECLTALGADVDYHIPLRLKDGYGLSADAIRRSKESGCGLAVSVDCGVSAHEEAELAAELGIDLIVTDHHQPPETLPQCLALINPHLARNRFPWPDLSGVGVAFFLMVGLYRRLRESGFFASRREPDLRRSLDLVALGTIADLVPLGGTNRVLVRTGLELLENGGRPGVRALKKVADVKTVTSGSVGFRLAPRLNAAGRLEDATLGVQLLLENEPLKAESLASVLDTFNRERQQIEQQTLDDAVSMLESRPGEERFTIVLASEGWHSGVVGIVASRLVERYHRPTVLIALGPDGCGKGSARSISGFHLYDAFCRCSDCFDSFGGHAMAAGLSIGRDAIASFSAAFEAVARERLDAHDLQPVLYHDGVIGLDRLSIPQLNEMELLSPFGMGNPQPAFVSRGCRVYNRRILSDKHLKFEVEQSGTRVDCIAFGMAERYDQLSEAVDLLYRPGINRWQGRESLQLQIVDFSS